ncbi:alpha/beta hydrolase [Sphingobacteriales bacterium UPWRP_1]|nr:hypothetical protein BVG80_00140 [Sphingobacteriales bacterium TSM_CSM]PSJ71765.1 alpha/beta hydrolase [Sphingobacteriales bacterium UPWRP_1]
MESNQLFKEQIKIDYRPGQNVSAVLNEFYHTPPVSAPVLVCLPAMGVAAKHYSGLAEELVIQLNCIAFTIDWRGLGTSSVRVRKGVNFGFKELLEDLDQTLSIIKSKYPESEIYLTGHSLGGQLACLYSAWGKTPVKGLILVACCSVYYKGWPGMEGLRILAFTQTARYLSRVLGYFPGKKMGFGGTESKTLIQDWSHLARSGRFEPQNMQFNFEKEMAKVTLPILSVAIAHDNYAPPKAIDNLCAKFPASVAISRKTIDGQAQNTPKLSHINWLQYPQAVVPVMRQWLQLQGR